DLHAVRRGEEYVANPVGHYVAGPTCLHFFADAALCGVVFWGRPTAPHVEQLTRALVAGLSRHSPLPPSFLGARRLPGIDAAAFEALAGFMGPRAEHFAVNVTRQAIVRPPGVLGAAVEGFYDVTRSASPSRTRVFTDPHEALAWLGREDAAALLATL